MRSHTTTGKRSHIIEQNLLLELYELGRGFKALLFNKPVLRFRKDAKRFGLTSRKMERPHELACESLAIRVLANQTLERCHEVAGVAEGEFRVEAVLHGLETHRLQRGDLTTCEVVVGERLVRTATPQTQSLSEYLSRLGGIGLEELATLSSQGHEPVSIDCVVIDDESVSGNLGQQDRSFGTFLAVGVEGGSQTRHNHPKGVLWVTGSLVAPQLVDDAVGGDHFVGVEQEER